MHTPRFNMGKSPDLAYHNPGDEIFLQLQNLVPGCMTSDHLTISGVRYMFFGENHFKGCLEQKEMFGERLLKMAKNRQIKLYVEEITKRESDLAKDAGLEFFEELRPNVSILKNLNSQPANTVSYFVSRPEDLHSFGCSGFMVQTGNIMQLIDLIQKSLDLRPAFINTYINIVVSIADDILNQSLLAAQRMQSDGLISEKLSGTIKEKLAQTLRDMVKELRNLQWKKLLLPFINQVRQTSAFGDMIEASVYAPHVVSDAVFATTLYRKNNADPPKVPVVIVSGIAHAKTLKTLLSVLSND
jgi:hypothetical protein